MKPWMQVAIPHKDVRSGTLKQSEFAADLARVAEGTASCEYQDASQFFARTYITDGMRELMVSVAKRLKGNGGDPVVQLKTNFGGGKTHSMLAVWHMATRKTQISNLRGVGEVLDKAGIDDLPQARAAVLVGTNITPNQPLEKDGKKIHTLWGRLAYELLGVDGYEMVEPSDLSGTAPGADVLVELLKRAAPCVILCDEFVAFLRKLINPKTQLASGSFENNISFVQSLTEAMKAVPNAILLASLPQSEEELGGDGGRDALSALEAVFTRVEAIWKPVAPEESFEIVRRRLFENVGDEADRAETCEVFMKLYHANPTLFPVEVQDASYADRMKKTYPIHPEVFDRLYDDWSTLPRFQKTRGVLQYMAIVINRLWENNSPDPLIMLGSIPLSDSEVEAKSTQYLIPGWEPVIESEIDGTRSVAGQLDAKPEYGMFKAVQRVARTIFFGSAPSSVSPQQNATRGADVGRIRLGSALPDMPLGIYEDILSDLRDRSQYLNVGIDRFWYDTRPNLRREMETRKTRIPQLKLEVELERVVRKVVGHDGMFSGEHIFSGHGDIEDMIKAGPRLVVMSPAHDVAYSRQNEGKAFDAAQEILDKRGSQPRAKANRLIFLFPDFNAINRLIEEGRKHLAWEDIVSSCEQGFLTLDTLQLRNAKDAVVTSDRQLEAMARECYNYLVVPGSIDAKKTIFTVERVNTQNVSIAASISSWICENEFLIRMWSPIFLKQLLDKYYFKNSVEEVSLKKVWNDMCSYLYMPRVLNEDVFVRALTDGVVVKDYFGFVEAKDGEEYVGFKFGEPILVPALNDSMLVVSKKKAEELDEMRKCKKCGKYPCSCAPEPGMGQNSPASSNKPVGGVGKVASTGVCGVKHYFGTISLDPLDPVMKMSDVLENVISLFTSKPGVEVIVKLDIEATSQTEFDKNTVIRPVAENSRTIGFSSSEFSV